MKYDPDIHHRRSIRLPRYDYSRPGVYFINLCTEGRLQIFGKIIGDRMILNQTGRIIQEEWLASAEIRSEIELDEFVIMPNHFHALVWISCDKMTECHLPRSFSGTTPKSIESLMQGFKSATTSRINRLRPGRVRSIWQRNYYERIIRNDRDLQRAREYIQSNPAKWAEDKNNPANP